MESHLPFVKINGFKLRFSENLIFRSVLKTGVPFEDAVRVMEYVKDSVFGRKSIAAEELFEITKNALTNICGSKFTKRYELWHRYNVLRRRGIAEPLQILVGGPPGVGKTVSLTDVGFRLAISRTITTDAIRRVLKVLIKEDPILHLPSYRVWKKLPGHEVTEHPEIEGFVKQVEFLSPFIVELVKKSIKDKKDVAIEGVHVTPWLLESDLLKKPNVIQVFLKAPEKGTYRQMFFSKRLREGETDRQLIEEDFEACTKINEFLVEEARKRRLHIIKFRTMEQTVGELLEVVNFRIKRIVCMLNGMAAHAAYREEYPEFI